jgi:hypothetical protein
MEVEHGVMDMVLIAGLNLTTLRARACLTRSSELARRLFSSVGNINRSRLAER